MLDSEFLGLFVTPPQRPLPPMGMVSALVIMAMGHIYIYVCMYVLLAFAAVACQVDALGARGAARGRTERSVSNDEVMLFIY